MQGFYALGYYFLRNYFKEFFWCWWYGLKPCFSFCASEKNMSLLLSERKHMNLRAHWSRNRSVEAHAISVSAIEFPSSSCCSCIIYFLKYSVKLLPASFSLFVQVPVSIPRRFQSTGQRQLSSNSCHTWHFVCLRVLRGREGKVRVKTLDPRMVFSTVKGKVGCLF